MPSSFAVGVAPLAGETLDIEAQTAAAVADPAIPAAGVALANAAPNSSPAPAPGMAPSRRAANESKPVGSVPALFGAVGERSAADLVATFVRAFPQAASADPIWSSASFGAAGADVALAIDDSGHLTRIAVTGSPSLGSTTPRFTDMATGLRRGIDRTIGLLGGRLFTSRGAVTRLRIAARLSRDELHDGLHGDVFALSGGSFSGDVGSAFFALPATAGPGRRVDVEFRILR
jgi:hypothetical protein